MAEGDGLKHDVYSAHQDNAFDWDKWGSYDKEWWIQLRMDIKEVRLLYSMVSFYLDNYSGAPGRPNEEQYYLPFLKGELYKMIQDYNLTHNSV
jgi:hypothetical protein